MTQGAAKPRGWSIFFWLAAAFNLAVGLPGLFGLGPAGDLGAEAQMASQTTSLLVVCFGILYGIVARDPLRLAPALWSAVVGKFGVVAIVAPQVFAGATPPGTGPIIALDALFGLAFLYFLLTRPKTS